MENIEQYIRDQFGVPAEDFVAALKMSPGSEGGILGAISEYQLMRYLHENDFETHRIKEKPAGGNDAKSDEARGDFYIRKKGSTTDQWYVLESKGLKSNSEFRNGRLDSKEKVFRFLKKLVFEEDRDKIYSVGYRAYSAAKNLWELKNTGKAFPAFGWDKASPGPSSCDLKGLWKTPEELRSWVESQEASSFTEEAYRSVRGPITTLETHKPSKRVCSITNISQACPLVTDFSILAVDLFLRLKKHVFVFMNPRTISHSPELTFPSLVDVL